MLREKETSKQKEYEIVRLDELVPQDHILRKIDAAVDFSFIHDLCKDLYSPNMGRPAIEPELLFRMLFLGYLYGIKSETKLAQQVNENIAPIPISGRVDIPPLRLWYNTLGVMRMRDYTISAAEYQKLVEAEKQCKDKRASKKLAVLLVRFSGVSIAETARRMNCSARTVARLAAEYRKLGLEEFMRNKYVGGNHRSLSEEEEKGILAQFEKIAEEGHVVTAQDIKKAFDERIGKDTGRGYIYMLLKRHGWRKVMPRAKHPRKADEEAIEASKKITTP